MELVTCSAPVNIAVVKYWGKHCVKLNIPLNDSLSVTLHQNDLKTLTTAATCRSFQRDRVWLNGNEVDVESNSRLSTCIFEIRKLAREQAINRGEVDHEQEKYAQKVAVCSRNNFPTAAGLASSAAGYAALVASLARLFHVEGDLSGIARRGSGSASRSMYGGFVEWTRGSEIDGSDSVSRPIFSEQHWPELRVFILVVSGRRKATGSTDGMQRSVETSTLLQYRASSVVAKRMAAVKKAIASRDFDSFAEICMKESNQLHAICRDTFPPLHYLNETSRSVMDFVHACNQTSDGNLVAYTFDAGPNAFLFTLNRFKDTLAQLLRFYFGPSDKAENGGEFIRGTSGPVHCPAEPPLKISFQPQRDMVEYVICTEPGPGPIALSDQHLINSESGLPY